MVTHFLLIRHGLTDAVGHRITGRLPGVHINETGREQAQGLAALHVDVIYASPLERAQETAAPLARRLGLPVCPAEQFNEVDFGEWSGLTLDDLEAMPEWKDYNRWRGVTRAPHGERMLEVQARVVDFLDATARKWPEKTVAVFSHADVIKAAVAHCLQMPFDFLDRLVIDPGSVTRVDWYEWGVRVVGVNEKG